MKNIAFLSEKINSEFSNGKTLEDFTDNRFGVKRISVDKTAFELFGDPIEVIKEFESKFSGEFDRDLVDHLVQAGYGMLLNYENLVNQELAFVTPSMSEIVCAGINGGIDLDEVNKKRVRISEKLFVIISAQRELQELTKEMEELGPKAPKRLSDFWFGPLPK